MHAIQPIIRYCDVEKELGDAVAKLEDLRTNMVRIGKIIERLEVELTSQVLQCKTHPNYQKISGVRVLMVPRLICIIRDQINDEKQLLYDFEHEYYHVKEHVFALNRIHGMRRHISELPYDVVAYMSQWLSAADRKRFGLVCSTFRSIYIRYVKTLTINEDMDYCDDYWIVYPKLQLIKLEHVTLTADLVRVLNEYFRRHPYTELSIDSISSDISQCMSHSKKVNVRNLTVYTNNNLHSINREGVRRVRFETCFGRVLNIGCLLFPNATCEIASLHRCNHENATVLDDVIAILANLDTLCAFMYAKVATRSRTVIVSDVDKCTLDDRELGQLIAQYVEHHSLHILVPTGCIGRIPHANTLVEVSEIICAKVE